jgi:hypothetical protein
MLEDVGRRSLLDDDSTVHDEDVVGHLTDEAHLMAHHQHRHAFPRHGLHYLQDLTDHGLLDSTIVWVSGEFGRTPKVQTESPWNGGRGHWGKVFAALVAGGVADTGGAMLTLTVEGRSMATMRSTEFALVGIVPARNSFRSVWGRSGSSGS